ncbi:MAG: hypothetical protein EOQ86_19290 [Mesorhizobium sp.]|uniref:hypothetical protein n=1 Tax=Mesorhizobium sp. TaxID=1871066 RepID=UPI000FE91147|nr:hypothetical protein [Mesorhizobium sp.]RWH77546.1 MAG: hypothetical protein EOQ85_17785 [Mesorhizobium sp.]RWH80764.1 MAG: hypothetical protein EOQ86_19290 [Mesorhizobium sp.]RWH89014.1 MAG: hypothetical protein EOQ87_19730 [Mesorhizobium sp.]RWH97037.1 MAG: hypothetical protein EOQ88_18740 [Mesorhizobium sp.]RWI00167.1 MAG: hypothetical protein EOQ89_20630 [Mesorhizobium sp.]
MAASLLLFIGCYQISVSARMAIAAGIDQRQREIPWLKRVASEEIHATRFKFLFLCMSLSQNRCALLGDMH